MKKILLTALVAVASLTASAQVWVGGSLGYTHSEADVLGTTVKQNTFEIAPEVGYSLSDKVDLALALGFTSDKVKGQDAETHFRVNPYVRWTFYQTGAVGFFVDGGFWVKTSSVDGEKAEFGIGLRPGVKFAASDKVTFVASVGGLGYCGNVNNIDKAKAFGLGVDGNDLKFGVYYTF